jgi:hypothetical protein
MRLTTKLLSTVVLMGIGASVIAQGGSPDPGSHGSSDKVTRRLKIRHADPYLIFLMLSGNSSTAVAPEYSTIFNLSGNGGFGGNGRDGGQNGGQNGGSNSGWRGGGNSGWNGGNSGYNPGGNGNNQNRGGNQNGGNNRHGGF